MPIQDRSRPFAAAPSEVLRDALEDLCELPYEEQRSETTAEIFADVLCELAEREEGEQ
jgi:hypothetical protein